MVSVFHEPGNTVSFAPVEVEILFPGNRYSMNTAKLTAALVVLASSMAQPFIQVASDETFLINSYPQNFMSKHGGLKQVFVCPTQGCVRHTKSYFWVKIQDK